jgi:hypothetical protein
MLASDLGSVNPADFTFRAKMEISFISKFDVLALFFLDILHVTNPNSETIRKRRIKATAMIITLFPSSIESCDVDFIEVFKGIFFDFQN